MSCKVCTLINAVCLITFLVVKELGYWLVCISPLLWEVRLQYFIMANTLIYVGRIFVRSKLLRNSRPRLPLLLLNGQNSDLSRPEEDSLCSLRFLYGFTHFVGISELSLKSVHVSFLPYTVIFIIYFNLGRCMV
jgi:hypothetical protein